MGCGTWWKVSGARVEECTSLMRILLPSHSCELREMTVGWVERSSLWSRRSAVPLLTPSALVWAFLILGLPPDSYAVSGSGTCNSDHFPVTGSILWRRWACALVEFPLSNKRVKKKLREMDRLSFTVIKLSFSLSELALPGHLRSIMCLSFLVNLLSMFYFAFSLHTYGLNKC